MTAEKDEIAKRIGRNITNLLIENDIFRHTEETEKPNKINKNPGTLEKPRNSGMRHVWIYNPLRYSVLR